MLDKYKTFIYFECLKKTIMKYILSVVLTFSLVLISNGQSINDSNRGYIETVEFNEEEDAVFNRVKGWSEKRFNSNNFANSVHS